jgi:hypothetical protein
MRKFRHDRVEVTDEPTVVCALPQDISSVMVRNVGTTVVYLGGEDVCAPSNDAGPQGFPLKAEDGPFAVPCVEYDVGELYAVTAKGKSGTVVFLVAS